LRARVATAALAALAAMAPAEAQDRPIGGFIGFLASLSRPAAVAPPPVLVAPAPRYSPRVRRVSASPVTRPEWPAFDEAPRFSGGAYRTLCVRACDAFFFPLSERVSPAGFATDAERCAEMCPNQSAWLFAHRVGASPREAVALDGTRYADLPNAFAFRTRFDAACRCRTGPEVSERVDSWAPAEPDATETAAAELPELRGAQP
jgi:hypothetical protein